MDKTSISMIREDLKEDFHALADGHTKVISTLLEEFNDDQMMLMIQVEQALNDNAPKQPTPDDKRPTNPNNNTSPILQSNEQTEPIPNQLAKESSDPRPKEDTAEPQQAEGILHILTED